jgi:hypothetical protein
MIEKIIFGDNQFFGVNHMSEEKSHEQVMRFNSVEKMVETLKIAYDCGVHGFMLHSHPLANSFCDLLRADPEYWTDLKIYPAIPHPVKYINKVSEAGVYQTLIDLFKQGENIFGTMNTLAKGGLGLLSMDVLKLAQSLIDIELQPFRKLKIGAIFLHNIVVDLLLGFGINSLYKEIDNYVRSKYDSEIGFITLNLPLLSESLKREGFTNPLIMAPFNKMGYYMNPGRKECELFIAENNIRLVAMSVLASGAIQPDEAVSYLKDFKIDSVIFGASTKNNIEKTYTLINNSLFSNQKN